MMHHIEVYDAHKTTYLKSYSRLGTSHNWAEKKINGYLSAMEKKMNIIIQNLANS